MIKKIVKNLIVLIVTLIICLIGLELAVRVIYPKVNVSVLDKEVFIEDNLLGYKLRPNVNIDKVVLSQRYATRSNRMGLRNDVDYDNKTHKNILRILGLGDSVAYGFGVNIEETYLKALEAKLNTTLKKRKKSAQVINAAFPGWGIAQELLFLKSQGLNYQPDIILVGFVSDDIYRNGRYYETALNYKEQNEQRGQEETVLKSPLKDANSVHNFILNKTQLYPFLLAKVTSLRNEDYRNYALSQTEDIFLEMQRICNEKRVELVVIIIPLRQQEDEVNDLMLKFFNNNGIKVIDLRDAFINTKQDLFLPNDNHPNPKGHKLIADSIYQYLVEN
jgi:lysophospholipase L1-like esterase